MSIQNEIDRITNNVAEAYAAVEEKGGSVPEEANSDKLAEAIRSIESGEAAAYAVNAPIGSIILWSGPESTIPTGWHICDGTNGTEDLRGRFALGASENHPIGETGGEEEVTLTVEQMPEHRHVYNGGKGQLVKPGTEQGAYSLQLRAELEGWNTTYTGSSQPHSNMPPYLALYYIQKISATPTDYATREDVEEMVGLPVKPITEAEYSALSDEDKNGETAWLVTDAEGSGGNGDDGSDSDGGEIYSTEEVRIGTWINGKPLYRRVITVFNISGTSTPTVITVYNMPGLRDVLFGGELERVDQNKNWIWPVTIGVDGTYVSPRYNKVTGDIMMDWLFGNPDIVYDLYLIIEYTKTTD